MYFGLGILGPKPEQTKKSQIPFKTQTLIEERAQRYCEKMVDFIGMAKLSAADNAKHEKLVTHMVKIKTHSCVPKA